MCKLGLLKRGHYYDVDDAAYYDGEEPEPANFGNLTFKAYKLYKGLKASGFYDKNDNKPS